MSLLGAENIELVVVFYALQLIQNVWDDPLKIKDIFTFITFFVVVFSSEVIKLLLYTCVSLIL